MGLFASLFSPEKVQETSSGKAGVVVLTGFARFDQSIRGVQRFQSALEAICGPRASRGVNRLETARLILENNNPGDKNAVRVEIRGRQVGYLMPEAAIQFRRELKARNMPKANGQCQAAIRGGWASSDGRKGSYEVWLDLPNFATLD
jgi:hypothetical protein